MPYRYMPIVRTKAGEATALGNLSARAKSKILPIIKLTRSIPATFAASTINQLSGFQIALDGEYNFSVTGNQAVYLGLFQTLLAGGVPVIPSLSFNPDPGYLASVASLVTRSSPDLVMQVSLADLANAAQWVAQQGWNRGTIDLVINAGGVAEHPPALLNTYISAILNGQLNSNHGWRTVTLHSWSAPKDHGALAFGRNVVPRRDWQLWQHVSGQVNFQLDYSDCGHVHPSLEEVPGYAMANATVSVRYAVDDDWLIYKGVATSGARGQPMPVQYQGHARTLVADPQFDAVANCWGDDQVRRYAATTGGTGGRSQWAALLLNRHLSLVADRLP
ncbi:hypothetical protein LMIY3S_02727 [Labrys miyagiensis]